MFITRLLIITVLAYFIGLIFCYCVILKCGDTIKYHIIKMKEMLPRMMRTKQTTSVSLHMEQLRSTIPDVAFNYSEFQEPLQLVALD